MCVIIHCHNLHSVFEDDVALLEIFQGPPDRKPSFHRHLNLFYIYKLPFNSKLRVPVAKKSTLTETRFDDVGRSLAKRPKSDGNCSFCKNA